MACGASLPSPDAFLVPIDDKNFKTLFESPPTAVQTVYVEPQFSHYVLPVMQTSPAVIHGADATITNTDGSVLAKLEMRLQRTGNSLTGAVTTARCVAIKDGGGTQRGYMVGTHGCAWVVSAAPYFEGQQPSSE